MTENDQPREIADQRVTIYLKKSEVEQLDALCQKTTDSIRESAPAYRVSRSVLIRGWIAEHTNNQ